MFFGPLIRIEGEAYDTKGLSLFDTLLSER